MALTMNRMSFDERFAALDDDMARFVSKVYSGLTYSLIIATAVCALSMSAFEHMEPEARNGAWITLLLMEGALVLGSIFIRLRGVFGWIFLSAFVAVTGAALGPVLLMYQKASGTATIAAALGLTATIFLTLSAYVRYSGKDFSYIGGFIWMATIGLIVSGLALMFFPSPAVSYFRACIGALIFCGWILYDTSAVTRQYYRDNNVVGAILALYVDILNLFMFLLEIFGGNRRRD